MDQFSPLAQKLQSIEAYLNTLVTALQRGEFPVNLKNISQVFDQAIGELPRLSLPPEKFCDLYNDIPTILSAYAITVTLNAASYRQTSSQVVFERLYNGNYWVIPLATTPAQAWLVPNPTRRIDLTRLDSLPLAFDWPDRDNPSHQNTFTLMEPAIVNILPTSPLTWKLIKRGAISSFLNIDTRRQNQYFTGQPDAMASAIEIEAIIEAMVEQAVDDRLAAMKPQILSQLQPELQNTPVKPNSSGTAAPIEENTQDAATAEAPSLGDLWLQSLSEIMIQGDDNSPL
jgi:hypothetical protein